MHEMIRSLVAVVSWYNFKLIWLHRPLVIKTTKQKINLTYSNRKGLKKQGTSEVATLHNIPINIKLNLHYLSILF